MNKTGMMQEARYTIRLYQLISYFESLSVCKCVFTIFCLENCLSKGDNVGRLKYDVFENVLARLNSKILLYQDDFLTIVKSLDILAKANYIQISDKIITFNKKYLGDIEPLSDKEIKICREIYKMNDVWFMEEIINHV